MATYIDNNKLLEEFKLWKASWDGDTSNIPAPTLYMQKAFLEIPKRFASTPKFYGYTYKEDMVCEATLNILQNFHKFNEELSNNPFAYITQICHFTFISFIQKERKQSYIKRTQLLECVHEILEDPNIILNADELNTFNENDKYFNGQFNKNKRYNKCIDESIENIICPDFNKEELYRKL